MKSKTLPFLVDFQFMADFAYLEEHLQLLDDDVRVTEVEFPNDTPIDIPPHVLVVYHKGHKPTRKQILAMAKEEYGEYKE